MIVLVLILIYTSLTVNYSYLRIIRLTMLTWIKVGYRCGFWITNGVVKLSEISVGDLACTAIGER